MLLKNRKQQNTPKTVKEPVRNDKLIKTILKAEKEYSKTIKKLKLDNSFITVHNSYKSDLNVGIYKTLIFVLMKNGNKVAASHLITKIKIIFKTKWHLSISRILTLAAIKVQPAFFTKRRRMGGTKLSIPYPAEFDANYRIAIRIIVNVAKKKGKNIPFAEALEVEIISTVFGNSDSIKVKERIEKEATQNKAYSYLRYN